MYLRKVAEALVGSTTRESVRSKYQGHFRRIPALNFFADVNSAASIMQRVRDNVHRHSLTVLRNGGDASVQELLLMLANEYDSMARAINGNGERTEVVATDLEQALDAKSRVLKDLVDELQHHDAALKRITARLTLLEGVALGVSQP